MPKKIQYVKVAPAVDWADADLSKGQRAFFPNLKPTREAISLRVPTVTLDKVRRMANRAGVPSCPPKASLTPGSPNAPTRNWRKRGVEFKPALTQRRGDAKKTGIHAASASLRRTWSVERRNRYRLNRRFLASTISLSLQSFSISLSSVSSRWCRVSAPCGCSPGRREPDAICCLFPPSLPRGLILPRISHAVTITLRQQPQDS